MDIHFKKLLLPILALFAMTAHAQSLSGLITDEETGQPLEAVMISVLRNGTAYVFERFYQADMTIARQRGGTGLGLAIVKGIVRAHQGTISLDGEPGCGTCFTIELPY